MKILFSMGDEILWFQYKNVKHAQIVPLSPQTATWEGRPEASKTLMLMHTTDWHDSLIHYSTYTLSYCKSLISLPVALKLTEMGHMIIQEFLYVHMVIKQKL